MNEWPVCGLAGYGLNGRNWVIGAGMGGFRPGRTSPKETPLHPLHDTFVIRLAMPKAYHRAVERRVYRP